MEQAGADMKVETDVAGFKNIYDRFQALNEKARIKIMKTALRAGTRVYHHHLIGTKMNVKTGNLRRGYRRAYIKATGGIRTDTVYAWLSIPRKGGVGAPHAQLYEWGTKNRKTSKGENRGRMPAFYAMSKALDSAWPTMRKKMEQSVDRQIKKALKTPSALKG